MIKDERDIKDAVFTMDISLKDKAVPFISYGKTSKLITALYMVTDVLDKEEPLRTKLRILGADLLSDIYSNFSVQAFHLNKIINKIDEMLSLLDIAGALNMISGMNSSILKKEFLELKQSIKKSSSDLSLAELLKEEENISKASVVFKNERPPIEHQASTRIGVQKGSTLLKALSDKASLMSYKKDDFNILKNKRREEILKIVKHNSDNSNQGLTITDIKNMVKNFSEKLDIKVLVSCGEKTLQRELISMVKDGVLYKTGEKRWSKYFIKN